MAFSVSVLGSSSALPTSKRNLTAHVLNVDERFFLVDCGEGTQIQMRRQRVRMARINNIFISHLHADHYLGLFGLLMSYELMNRQSPLNIYSHQNLEQIIKCFLDHNTPLSYPLRFHALQHRKAELIYDDEKVSVTSFPLKHRVPTCGFLFRQKERPHNIRPEAIKRYNIPIREIQHIKHGADFTLDNGQTIPNHELTTPPPTPKSYAFCSDTVYTEKILPVIKDVDLLYHEATYLHKLADVAKKHTHTTARQAAEIALKANAKRLLIGHFSSRYKTTDELEAEARTVFPETTAVEDGMTYMV